MHKLQQLRLSVGYIPVARNLIGGQWTESKIYAEVDSYQRNKMKEKGTRVLGPLQKKICKNIVIVEEHVITRGGRT